MINVYSEIGKLNTVLLHRPGVELESLTPDTMAELLFDDVPYLDNAQKEHDKFAALLKKEGTQVVYLGDLLGEVLKSPEIKKQFLKEFILNSNVLSPQVQDALIEYMMPLTGKKLIDKVFGGIRFNELDIKLTSVCDILHGQRSLFWINPLPNLYFTRDPAAAIGGGLNIHYMRKTARKPESLFLDYIHRYHDSFKRVPTWYDRSIPYPIEGGDVIVLSSKVLAVGYSERTSARAIEIWAQKVLSSPLNTFEKILVVVIPKTRAFMHLDTVFTMVDYDKFTSHSLAVGGDSSTYVLTMSNNTELKIEAHTTRLDKVLANVLELPSVKLIVCGNGDPIVSGREQWNDGSNTLAISPGKVIVYERNYVTNELLTKNNITVLEIEGGELSRGRGGPRCMSMPLNRNDL